MNTALSAFTPLQAEEVLCLPGRGHLFPDRVSEFCSDKTFPCALVTMRLALLIVTAPVWAT
jgi:hypothetical protein